MATTEFSVAAGADDGRVQRSDTVYPPGGAETVNTSSSSLTVMRLLETGVFNIWVGLLFFDTSSLAGSTVSAATLRFYLKVKDDDDARNLTVEWYAGTNRPIDAADYTDVVGTDAHAGADITGLTLSADNDLVLTGAAAAVNVNGYTGLRLHISGGQPSGLNSASLAALEDASNPEPRLIVTYEPPPVNTARTGGVIRVGP